MRLAGLATYWQDLITASALLKRYSPEDFKSLQTEFKLAFSLYGIAGRKGGLR